jgi:excisionase family DNA binding protein
LELAVTTEANTLENPPAAEAPKKKTGKTLLPIDRPPLIEGALAYGIADASRAIGASRSTVYELMNEGKLRSVYVRGRRLIPRDALLELLSTGA